MGVVIPKNVVEEMNLKEKDSVLVTLNRGVKVRDLWGIAPELKGDTQKIKDELRKGWD